METSLVSQIARKVFLKSANVPKALQKDPGSSVISDSVSISKDAQKLQKIATGETEFEKNRDMHVEHIKSLVQSGNYQFNGEIIDKIAEKIADTLL